MDIQTQALHGGFLDGALSAHADIYRDLGCCAPPFNSFLHLTGVEGLALRMDARCRNAQALAEYLDGHAKVKWVNYPGLSSNPSNETAKRLFGRKFGGVLTFGLGSAELAFQLIDNLSLAKNLANIGDSKTLVSTIFRGFGSEDREAMGVPDDLIRVYVGVESETDITADFGSAIVAL